MTARRLAAFVCVFALGLAACVSSPEDQERERLHKLPPKKPPAPVEQKLPDKAEVEISGRVDAPAGTKNIRLFVTDGECWKPTSHSLGDRPAIPGPFVVEVFVPQGTKLWLCGAVIPEKGKITFYGADPKSPYDGRGMGEVTFNDVVLALAKGPPVDAPTPK